MNFKKIVTVGMLAMMMGVSACGSVSQKYADKINELAQNDKKDDELTFEKVCKDLGDDYTGGVALGAGECIWSVKDKDGKVKYTIAITFLGGKAVAAVYADLTQKK